MKIGFVVFDGMTALDFVGVFDPLTRLKTMGFIQDLTWDICALTPEVTDGVGLTIRATRVNEPLTGYDMVVIPGGFSTRQLIHDPRFVEWVKTAAHSPVIATVCSGSLLIGAAGILEGKKATTHPSAYEQLRPYCREVLDERVVDEDTVITARGVTSAIDLGLYLVEKLAGSEARERIRKQMDYRGP